MGQGLVHVYTGDGKGKTTAAVGLCVRMTGAGKRCAFIQFLKGPLGKETGPLRQLGVEVITAPQAPAFSWRITGEERLECTKQQERLLEQAKACFRQGFDLVVLDEAATAVSEGFLDQGALLFLMDQRPFHAELVITGRNASDEMVSRADYVSVIQEQKHPFRKGVKAREGIEY